MTGISYFGATIRIQDENGKPYTLVSNQNAGKPAPATYLISAEGPDLSRCTRHSRDGGEEDEHDQKRSQHAGRRGRASCILQDLDDWERGIALEECRKVRYAKAAALVSDEIFRKVILSTHQNVISMVIPRTPFRTVAHIIALGSCSEESFNSSDI